MIRRIPCFVVECDECRAVLGDTDGGVYHFETDTDALSCLAAESWMLTEDGTLRCHSCAALRTCIDQGHAWGLWTVCACHGQVLFHDTEGCGLYRVCHRCAVCEEATLATLPTTEQPHQPGR